jgi:hypothetical protein
VTGGGEFSEGGGPGRTSETQGNRDALSGSGNIKEESGVPAGGMPGSSQGRGRSRSGASPRPS